jgi:hypothetical protein
MFALWWNPWDWSKHTLDVLVALGTTGAVIVALGVALLTSLFRRWHRPTVGLSHDPDADRTVEMWVHRLACMGDLAAFVRLGVSNGAGRHAAEDVQVFVVSVNGKRVNFGPLGWTHMGESIPLANGEVGSVPGTKQTLGPGITRTVDLGYAVAGQPTFALAVSPEPLTEAHKVKTGDIDLVLAVSPRNADAQHFTMTLSFDGPWLFDHEGADDGSDAWKKLSVSKLPKPTKSPS